VGPLRVDGSGEQRTNSLNRIRVSSDIKRGDVAIEAEVALPSWPPDQRAQVEPRHEPDRVHDADHCEPLPAEPDLRAFMHVAKSEALGCPCPEHNGWVAGSCSIEP